MTRAKFESLAAHLNRMFLIVHCIQAFDDCYYGIDLDQAERDLKVAMDSKPEEFPLTAPVESA